MAFPGRNELRENDQQELNKEPTDQQCTTLCIIRGKTSGVSHFTSWTQPRSPAQLLQQHPHQHILLQIHNSPIPPWMLSEMKEAACTGALSAPLALSLAAHSLRNREREREKKKKESEYSSSSCTLQPFYSTCFDLLAACRRHSNGSKSQRLCIRGFSPSFAISLTRTHLFARLNHPSSLAVSPSVRLYFSCPPVAGRVFLLV